MNFQRAIPAFYWPTKLVFIDGDYAVAKAFSELFPTNPNAIFENPLEGIDYINGHNKCVSEEDEFVYNPDLSSEKNHYFAIKNLHKKLYKNKRFEEISTLIIDYDMPQCNGLEAVNKLRNLNINVVLLTGVASELLAISAFNQCKIDRYLKKLSENADLQLIEYAEILQMEYFLKKTQTLLERNAGLKKILENAYIVRLFADLMEQKNIVEFYLLDDYGSFLLVDNKKKLHVLIFYANDVLKGVIELMQANKTLDKTQFNKLKNKTHLLPYASIEQIEQDPKLFEKYLLPCQRIPEANVYYALNSEISFSEVEKKKIKFK